MKGKKRNSTTVEQLFMLIHKHPGIHVRALCRELKLGIPSVKYGLNKLLDKKIVVSKQEGKNLKFYVNHKNQNYEVIRFLHQFEISRIQNLPKKVRDAIYDFLKLLDAKPIITIIFGSYARGDYTEKSDLDLLLIIENRADEKIEKKADVISERYGIPISPVYLSWSEFYQKFFDMKDVFMKQIKENRIIFFGMEWWLMLENEKA